MTNQSSLLMPELDHVLIIRAEQQLTIYTCFAKSANAAMHAQTVSCSVRADQNHANLATK